MIVSGAGRPPFGYSVVGNAVEVRASVVGADYRLSPHVQLWEWLSNDGDGPGDADRALVDPLILKAIEYIGDVAEANGNRRTVHINSGYRTPEYNATLPGASSTSQHLTGHAADIRMDDISPEDLAAFCHTLGFNEVGCYNTFVHIGVRSKPATRWFGSSYTGSRTTSEGLPVFPSGPISGLPGAFVTAPDSGEVSGVFGSILGVPIILGGAAGLGLWWALKHGKLSLK